MKDVQATGEVFSPHKPALPNMKLPHFFQLLRIIIFDLLDLDPADQAKADPCGTGSITLVKSSVPDP
jgi:hypothetical protein